MLLFRSFFLLLCLHFSSQFDPNKYLERYGYKNPSDPRLAALVDPNAENSFIIRFQQTWGLPVTGKLDAETKDLMTKDRCGNPDLETIADAAKRKKRFALQGSRWGTNRLSYKITQFTSDLLRSDVEKDVRRSLDMWTSATGITFVRTNSARPDIEVKFVAGAHGDVQDFDGSGGTLAHAFFPNHGGDVHFDEAEQWTRNTRRGRNLFQVALHEFGHALGLKHSNVRESIMAPFYSGYNPNTKLHQDDIDAMRNIYRDFLDRLTTRPSTRQPRTPAVIPSSSIASRTVSPTRSPNYCTNLKVDAVIRSGRSHTIIFSGTRLYFIDSKGVVRGSPLLISQLYSGVIGNIDAALNLGQTTFLFKRSHVWRYQRESLVPGYPKRIGSVFLGLPNDIDAAFVWGRNGSPYVMKGNKYYRLLIFLRYIRVYPGYPRPLSVWKGLPSSGVDAAFRYSDGRTFFFKGNQYYGFNDAQFRVDNRYPRSISKYWLGCKSSSNEDLMLESNTQESQFINVFSSSVTTGGKLNSPFIFVTCLLIMQDFLRLLF